MRTGKIPAWVMGAVLCCAASAAFCQTLSERLGAGTVLSANTSHGATTVGAAGVRSEVSASANRKMNASFMANVNATPSDTKAFAEGGGAQSALTVTSARKNFRIGGPSNSKALLKEVVNKRAEEEKEGGLLSEQRLPALKKQKNSGRVVTRSVQRYKAKLAGQRDSGLEDSMRNPGTAVSGGGSYSSDFPDSTRGTAMLSPPDAGTASPLDWSPSFTHGFGDFTARRFLNPSLHAAVHSPSGKRREAARQRVPSTSDYLRYDLSLPSLSTSVGNSWSPGLTNSWDPLLDLQNDLQNLDQQ